MSDKLRDAYHSGTPMLAAVVRLNLLEDNPQLKITVQKDSSPRGRGMVNWGHA